MMNKALTLLSVLIATGAIGYIGYDHWQDTQASPMVVVSDPAGCIAESYSNLDEWDAKIHRAYVMTKKDKADEVVQLCNDSGLTVVSKHTYSQSDYTLLICAWNEV